MVEIKLNAENEATAKAFIAFIAAYKEHICTAVNLELRDSGHLADSYITVEDTTINIWAVAPEKGWVLGEVDDISKWEMIQWKYLEEDKLYIRQLKEGLTLFLKSEKGIPDVKIGQFISLDDAVTNVSSKNVMDAVAAAKASKKEQLKQIKKLQKLGKMETPINSK